MQNYFLFSVQKLRTLSVSLPPAFYRRKTVITSVTGM